MINALQYRRIALLATLLIALLLGLAWRLVDLQVLRHQDLRARALTNTQKVFILEPRRGDILDIHGNQLATSVFVKTVCANPGLIGNYSMEVARVLSPLLQTPELEISRKLQPRSITNEQGNFIIDPHVVLKRKVSLETWQQLTQTMARLSFGVEEKKLPRKQRLVFQNIREKGIFCEAVDDQLRVYRNQELAAHVLGYVGTKEEVVQGRKEIVNEGKSGMEFALNHSLTGIRGWRMTEVDSRRRELVVYRDQDVEAQHGLNAVLTLDLAIQHMVETELAEAFKKHTPISASAIVLRPRTGEILAMATLPTYDPNQPGSFPAEYLRNRVITDYAEPGSTFKTVVISAALNEGLVSLQEQIDCENGKFFFAGRVLHDHESHGVLTVENILSKSSNIGAAKIGIRLGEAKLHRYMTDFGFGQKTSLGMPGETGGTVHPLRKWTKLSISRIPMGHEMTATPLQMIMAFSAIANGGKLMRPMLVHQLQDQKGQVVARYYPQTVRRVIEEPAARQMVEALKTVVSTNGTAQKARLDHYQVAGKTGTAQKVGPEGYLRNKDYSSFIGFFPADAPEICISVVLDEPKNGSFASVTAAPVFKNIAERVANYLNIPPDLPVKAQIVTARLVLKTFTEKAPPLQGN